MTAEQKVKQVYPDAAPFTALMGWGIWVRGKKVLSIGSHHTLEKAWANAWRRIQAERKATK